MSQNGGLPIVGVTAEPKILIEGAGNRSSFVFRLSEPAPNGGLTLNVGFIEEDGAFGDDTLETENVASFDENDLGLISSVTIEAGKTEAKLTFVSLGDDILEDDESSTLFLIETPNYKIDPNAREATIIETDVPVVSMSVEAPTIDENGAGIFPEGPGNSASFVFTLSKPAPAGGLTLNLATFEQDGAFGDDTISTENIDDFSENALGTINSITITEGATTARFTLNSIGDDILEGPEETTIFLLDAIGYTPNPDASQATLIEVDDPNFVPSTPEPSLIVGVTAEPEILIEGAGNKSSFVFRLSEPAPEGGLILNVGFIEEDGASGDDALETENVAAFEANELGLTSSVTIEAGKTEARFTAVSLGDDILEDDESSTLFLIETPNYKVDPNAREATIIETDVPVVSISVEAPTIDENGAGIFLEGPGNSASFVFTLSKPAPAGGLTLNLATFEQDGAFGDDTISLENIDKFSENALGTINSITITEGATTARFTLNSIGDEILEGPEETTIFLLEAIGYTPNPDASQATLIETDIEIPGTTGGNTDQIVSFRLEDVFIPAQGGSVADTIIIIDQKDGLESFPDIVPVAEFVKDYLNTAPNEDDFLQDISTNLSQAILDNNSLGLSGTVDSISVQLDRKPAGILPFEFITTATNTHTGTTDQVVTINLQDVLVPVQGGTVADVSIIIDQKDGLQTFPDLIPVANFTEEFLTTYDNPDDFYQDISNNLTQAILSNPDLGLAGTVDSVSVQLNREAAGIVPFNFSSQAIGKPEETTDQIVSFRLEDVFIPAQGGSVADTIITIDQKDGLESFPDIVPVAEFVKDYLNTAPNEDDFLQDISTNLSQAILDNNSLGLSGTVDSISVQLDRKPAGILPFEFITTATNTHTGTTDQVVTINLQDVLVPVQGGTVADVSIIIDQKDGLQTFPDLIPVANFTEEFLTTYDNPDDFYQDISNNLTQAILSNPDLGLAGTVDSVSVQLNREAAGIVPFNFSSQSISTPDTDTSTDLPVVSLSVSPELVSENNEQFTLTLNLSKPAPAGGLEVIFSETDSDNAFGDITSPPELTNASNFQSLNPVGEELARSVITIAEGATTASLSWKTLADSQTEGKETTTYTLLSNEGYQVDTDNSVDTLTILDTSTDVPTFTGTANNDVLPGTSVAEIINGLAGDDIIYGNGGGDIMFGGDDNDQIFGTIDADYMNGGDGDDTMYGNGGEDTLFGGNGDNLIYGGSQADTIITGDGDDTIYANGGGDNINSGAGLDTVWLGNGEATVVLDTGLGYDIIKNFQLGATTLQVASKDNLSFVDSADGAQILDGVDLLAVVSWNSADTFTNNADQIFVVA